MDFLLGIERQLRVAGGVFLVALGIWTFFKHPVEEGANPGGHHGAIATTFLLTLTNPMTLLAFVGFRSEEHTSELQSLMRISYAVFCLKKKNRKLHNTSINT